MNYSKKILIFALVFLFKTSSTFSQIVDASPETQTICTGGNATLTAVVTPGGPGSLPTTSYAVSSIPYAPNSYNSGTFITLSDDSQSAVLPIGFTFCFFGVSYTQFYIGSNGWVAFSPQSTSYTSAAVPSTGASVPKNCIMAPWQDWHPGVAGGPYINYQTLGTAPNRRLVVSWNNCPMFSCTTFLGKFQVVIYESTNIIENYIASKPNCTTWAGGTAVQGLHNAAGTVAYTVAGRNSTAWTATNEATRYTPNGVATYTINWYELPSNTLVGTGSPITVTPPAGQPSTSYYAQITGTSGCGAALASTDTVVVLQVSPSPPVVSNTSVCLGNTATLTASGSTGIYEWYDMPGGTLLGTGASFTTPPITAITSFYVQSNDMGCISSMATVTVSFIQISLSISATTAHCGLPDGTATVVPSLGTPVYTYLWSDGQTTATATGLLPAATCVTVTDADGCFDSICITVPNSPAGTASSTSTPASCNGVCDGTATATGSLGIAPYTYLWSNGQTTQTATGLCAGSYTCTVTDASGCTVTTIATITQPTIIVIDVIPPVTICSGQSTVLNGTANGGNAGGYTFNWMSPAYTGPSYTVSPTVTTTYTVTATDVLGCLSPTPQTVTVTVSTPLSVTASPNVSICPGSSTLLSSVPSGGNGAYSYNWMPGSGAASTLNVTPASTTTYTITITDGCTVTPATATVTVTILPLPVISFSPNTSSACEPICITFTDASTVAGGTISGWNWDFGNGSSSTLQSPAPVCYSAGIYDITLTATSNSGCVSTSTINNMITVFPQPVAQFTFGPQPATLDNPIISFTDLSVNATNWSWNFGDPANTSEPNTSSLINPHHIYADSGVYCATLIVQSAGGCPDTTTNCLTIAPIYTMYIPNAFTPNGDQMNNVFAPKGEHIDEFTMRIFDRWGNMIFKSTSVNEGWKGSVNNNGNVVKEDVYVYKIDVKDKNGKHHNYIGHVTIVK